MPSGGERIVLVKAPEGIGDRLITLLVGILHARASGRALAVDWSDGMLGERGINAFGALFRIENVRLADLPARDEPDVRPESWRGRLDQPFGEVWREDLGGIWNRKAAIARFSADLGRIDHPERVVVLWDFDQLAAVRSLLPETSRRLDDDALLARTWREHVRGSEAVEREVRAWMGGSHPTRIGVHVRATHEADRQQGAIAGERYFAVVDDLLRSTGAAEIVLATDNRAVEESFRARYDTRLRTRPKWFPPAWEPIHLSGQDPDPAASARAAVTELLAVARCDWLVTRRDSAFSHVARLASGLRPERLISLSPDAESNPQPQAPPDS